MDDSREQQLLLVDAIDELADAQELIAVVRAGLKGLAAEADGAGLSAKAAAGLDRVLGKGLYELEDVYAKLLELEACEAKGGSAKAANGA